MISQTPRLDLTQALPDNCRFLYIANDKILLHSTLKTALFDKPLIAAEQAQQFHIGYYNEAPVVAIAAHPEALNDHQAIPVKQFLVAQAPDFFQLVSSACHCLNFHKQNLFCGSCGGETKHSETELAKVCVQCDRIIYPQFSPAVLILIERGDEILLARSPHFPDGMYSTLAGFIEPGESAEQTVAREAYEEVAIHVRDIEYVGTQNWPFPMSYMIAYRAQYESGEIHPQENEIEDARWFHLDDLDDLILPVSASLSRQLIETFRQKRT